MNRRTNLENPPVKLETFQRWNSSHFPEVIPMWFLWPRGLEVEQMVHLHLGLCPAKKSGWTNRVSFQIFLWFMFDCQNSGKVSCTCLSALSFFSACLFFWRPWFLSGQKPYRTGAIWPAGSESWISKSSAKLLGPNCICATCLNIVFGGFWNG